MNAKNVSAAQPWEELFDSDEWETLKGRSMVEEALAYARKGFRVFPVRRNKSPWTEHGAHDGTTNHQTIRKWWKQRPDAGIGLALKGLVVVDFDPRNGGDFDAMMDLPGDLQGAAIARTGGGGFHYLFRAAAGARYPGKLAKGIDIKSGPGAYIVVAPSLHQSGQRYRWLRDARAVNLAAAPDWVAKSAQRLGEAVAKGDPGGTIPEGERDNTLMSLAGSMRHRGMTTDEIEAALTIVNINRCDPPLPVADIHRIAESVGRYEPGKARKESSELTDFWAYLPMHKYIHVPTRDTWPKESINGAAVWPVVGETRIAPSAYLDRHRPIHQLVWAPGEEQVVEGRIIENASWHPHAGQRVFNLYRSPPTIKGEPENATRWRKLLRRLYPEYWGHIEKWLAFKVQNPGRKINHALVLGGEQGIGKDTLLQPVQFAVGPWNWQEISPIQLLGRFNGWAKAVIVRLSEGRDLGDVDRYAFYEHSKTYIARPPDALRVDEKNLREHYVMNVLGLIITTNHRTDCLYLPADDRRHFVVWSDQKKDQFPAEFWRTMWNWYMHGGGLRDTAAYLHSVDLSGFDPDAPPPHTRAWEAIVQAGIPQEDGDLAGLIEAMGSPPGLTISDLYKAANKHDMDEIALFLNDPHQRARIPHTLERVGYVSLPNPSSPSRGRWKVGDRYVPIYVQQHLSVREQSIEARKRQKRG